MSSAKASAPPSPKLSARRSLPAGVALAGTALAFTSFYLGAGALTPLLVVYRQRWDFPLSTLTLAFAVYALGFLVAALVAGSLSDHVGRRPVLIASIVVQIGSNLLFLFAPDVSWIVAGRIMQGVASGAATSAFTASLVELAPAENGKRGALLGSVGLTGGLALGSLLAGLAIQFIGISADAVIFVALILLTTLGLVAVVFSPETVTKAPGAVRSLVPRVVIPRAARSEFFAAAPVVAAIWMLAGLSGGLAPSLVHSVFHLDSGLLNGFAGFVAPAVSVVTGLAFVRVRARRAMVIGIWAAILGSALITVGVVLHILPLMIVGQAIAGIGFGASFTAALSLSLPLSPPHQRAGLVAGLYVVSYTAFGLPIVLEGQLVQPLGEVTAVVAYSLLTLLFAVISLFAQRRIGGAREPEA
jgi:MFS family permease